MFNPTIGEKMKTVLPFVIAILQLVWVCSIGDAWYDSLWMMGVFGLLPMAIGAWLNEVFENNE